MPDNADNMILGYEETYSQRLNEIKDLIAFMALMDVIEQRNVDYSYNSIMEKAKEQTMHLYSDLRIGTIPSYSLVASVMRSNAKIMVYNMIEFTVSNLLQAIYDKIHDERCGYREVSNALKKLWHRSRLFKKIKNPSANDETIEQTSRNLLDLAVSNATLSFEVRDILSGGNLDGDNIIRLFRDHGVHLHPSDSLYRQDQLKDIRKQRNELAHGTISFSEAGRQDTVSDLNNILDNVDSFLRQLREDVIVYLNERQYRL